MNLILHDAKKDPPKVNGEKTRLCYLEYSNGNGGYWMTVSSYFDGWNCFLDSKTDEIRRDYELKRVLMWADLPEDVPCDDCPLCKEDE